MPPEANTKKRRRSIRLAGYNYSRAGAYFVTVCAADRRCLFGEIINGEMAENGAGKIVRSCWEDLPDHYPHVTLDAFVVMPNHVHGIVVLNDGPDENVSPDGIGRGGNVTVAVGAGFKPAPTGSGDAIGTGVTRTGGAVGTGAPIRHGLPEIVRALKTFSARRINALRGTPGLTVWQRNYYEHVIRNERTLGRVREYILANPQNWWRDREHPVWERG